MYRVIGFFANHHRNINFGACVVPLCFRYGRPTRTYVRRNAYKYVLFKHTGTRACPRLIGRRLHFVCSSFSAAAPAAADLIAARPRSRTSFRVLNAPGYVRVTPRYYNRVREQRSSTRGKKKIKKNPMTYYSRARFVFNYRARTRTV